jgi:hypothetical protein
MKKLALAVLMTAALWLVAPAPASAQTQYNTGAVLVTQTGCETGNQVCSVTVNPMPSANNCLNGTIYIQLDGSSQGPPAMYATALAANLSGRHIGITFTQAGGTGTDCYAVYLYMNND